MKNLLLITVLAFLASCSGDSKESIVFNPSDTSQINPKIRAYFMKAAHDPSSYQPVSTILRDTITALEQIESRITYAEGRLKMSKDLYEIGNNERYKADIAEDEEFLNSCMHEKDSIISSKKASEIIAYLYMHECRLKNKMGGLMLTQYKVRTDDSLNVLVAEEK